MYLCSLSRVYRAENRHHKCNETFLACSHNGHYNTKETSDTRRYLGVKIKQKKVETRPGILKHKQTEVINETNETDSKTTRNVDRRELEENNNNNNKFKR